MIIQVEDICYLIFLFEKTKQPSLNSPKKKKIFTCREPQKPKPSDSSLTYFLVHIFYH